MYICHIWGNKGYSKWNLIQYDILQKNYIGILSYELP